MIDVHCHLEQRDYNSDRDSVIRLCEQKLNAVITCCARPNDFDLTIQMLEKRASYTYLDLGPSGTLATFVKYNLHNQSCSKSFSILNPFGQDVRNLEKLKAILT